MPKLTVTNKTDRAVVIEHPTADEIVSVELWGAGGGSGPGPDVPKTITITIK